jgi:hypothetical protein
MEWKAEDRSFEFYEFKGAYYRASRDNFMVSDVLTADGWQQYLGEHRITAALEGRRLKRDPSLPPREHKPGNHFILT